MAWADGSLGVGALSEPDSIDLSVGASYRQAYGRLDASHFLARINKRRAAVLTPTKNSVRKTNRSEFNRRPVGLLIVAKTTTKTGAIKSQSPIIRTLSRIETDGLGRRNAADPTIEMKVQKNVSSRKDE